MRSAMKSDIYFVFLIIILSASKIAQCEDIEPVARLRTTSLGTVFEVNTVFDPQIDQLISEIRKEITVQRKLGKLIVYISTPISSRGGGYTPINIELSENVKKCLEKKFGQNYLWCLAPGNPIRPGGESVRIADVNGIKASGGDYMFMWTQILAGIDGQGRNFDMVYFTGPTDFHTYFKISGPNLIEKLDNYVSERAKIDEKFKSDIADKPMNRHIFLRYYALKAGAAYSTGAHDEWNIFVKLNQKRDIGDLISMYFNGKPLSTVNMDHFVTPGYEKQARMPLQK